MKKNIFLVDSGINIELLLKQTKKLDQYIIYTLDYDTHKKLERKKIKHLLGEDILDKYDFEEIDKTVISLTKSCFSKYRNSLIFNEISLPELIEHEFFQYLLQQFLKPKIISKLLENLEVNSVYDFTIYSDFIQRIIGNDIVYHNFTSSENSSLYHDKVIFNFPIASIPFHIELSRKTFTKLKKPIQSLTNTIYDLKPSNKKKQNILLVNFDVEEFENLFISLNQFDVNYLLLNTRKPAIINKKSLQIVKNTNSKIVNLNDFYNYCKFDIISSKKSLEKTLSLMLDDDYFEKSFIINNITFWNCIKKSFFKICSTRFNESIERIFLLKEFFNLYDIALNFLWIDVGQEEKECILVGKQFSIESVMLQHGRFQTSKIWNKFASFLGQFPAPMLSDKQIVWGEISKKYAISYDHSENNLLVGGSPRHDKFFNNKRKKSNGNIILATTGTMFLSADTCTTRSQIRYDDYVKEIYRIVKSIPGKKLIIKSHPSQILRKIVQDLINEIDTSITLIEDTNNQELFNDCDMVITFNNSTTCLEAISQHTPVISLQTESWALEDDIAQSNAIVSVSKLSDCEGSIKKILEDHKFKENLIYNSSQFLSDYMSNQGNASSSIAKILKNLI